MRLPSRLHVSKALVKDAVWAPWLGASDLIANLGHAQPRHQLNPHVVPISGTPHAVIICSKLNQDTGGDVPVDVGEDLRALGLQPAVTLADACRLLRGARERAGPPAR